MKIAFLHPNHNQFSAALLQRLRAQFTQHELISWYVGDPSPAHDFEFMLVMGGLSRAQIADQPKLAMIQTISTGYENIDLAAATELGIWVAYAPSGETGNAASVAEFALLLMIGASRHLNQALRAVRDRTVPAPSLNLALTGKTVCIVGLGGIGRLLIDLLRPFAITLRAVNRRPVPVPADVALFGMDDFATAVAPADYVVICVRADKNNENLIDRSAIAAMKRGSILINIARASLIDEAALIDALHTGHLAAAGLDVIRGVPPGGKNPLLDLPQVFITPHIGGGTDLMLEGTINYLANAINLYASGEKSTTLLNTPPHPRHPF
jgi:phosphoglycerate dehydrogenase-like enzyme